MRAVDGSPIHPAKVTKSVGRPSSAANVTVAKTQSKKRAVQVTASTISVVLRLKLGMTDLLSNPFQLNPNRHGVDYARGNGNRNAGALADRVKEKLGRASCRERVGQYV